MVFLICRRGLHAAMRRGFAVGARPLIRVWLELLEEDSDEPTVAELKRQLADMTEQRDRMHQAINDMAAERFSRQAAGEPQEQ